MDKKEEKNAEKEKANTKEYGVVLKKGKRHRYKIFPQKGKVPEKDDSFEVV